MIQVLTVFNTILLWGLWIAIIKIAMNNAQLLALLQAADASIHDIAGKVQTLLDTIASNQTGNIPQDITDAATALQNDLNALQSTVDGGGTPAGGDQGVGEG